MGESIALRSRSPVLVEVGSELYKVLTSFLWTRCGQDKRLKFSGNLSSAAVVAHAYENASFSVEMVEA